MISGSRFPKSERLRYRNLVEALFHEGATIYAYPLRLVWRRVDRDTLGRTFRLGLPPDIDPVQMMVTIPKRKQKRAVNRVLLRRRVREAYRLNRRPLVEAVESDYPEIGTLSLGFVYIADTIATYTEIEVAMRKILAKLRSRL